MHLFTKKNERKGFAQNRFKRDQFRKVAERTPTALVQLAYSNIKRMKSRIINKGEVEYDK